MYRLLTLFILLLLIVSGCAASLQNSRLLVEARQSKPVQKPFPVPIVVLQGSSAELGEQHGRQLSTVIHTLHDQYLMSFLPGQTQRLIATAAARLFELQMPPALVTEVHALAKGSGITDGDMMLGQCFLDLSEMVACSTVTLPASASPDHVARFGRNLDFPSLNVADKYTTLFIVKPNDGRYAFASVGWPGLIGVLSGMNEHGLCLANMEVTRQPRLPRAMPYVMLYRTVLERCRTVEEAVALLRKTPIQTANNLMLMDESGDRAVVELTPQSVHVRRGQRGVALFSTNHQRDQDQDTPGFCRRYDYMRRTTAERFGDVDEPAIEQMLAHVGDETTLQSMVFEPTNRVLYLSAGTDAAHRQFSRLDLRKYW